MSTKTIALATFAGISALLAINTILKPPKTQSITSGVRRQLDEFNSEIHPEPNPSDTIMDRKRLMENEKRRKPWNMTYAERDREGAGK